MDKPEQVVMPVYYGIPQDGFEDAVQALRTIAENYYIQQVIHMDKPEEKDGEVNLDINHFIIIGVKR